jgi:eukaryotic-like serine/threonine-protein kinase
VLKQVPPDAVTHTWNCADRVVIEFEEALKRSERPSIRSELGRVGPDAGAQLLPKLLGLEIVHRRRSGESVTLAEYESVLPEMSSLTPSERAELEDCIERPTPDSTSAVPTQIGRYPIVALLDRGGQAETFRAIHPGLQTTVVLKLAHRPAEPTKVDRIATEGRLLASLPAHRHLVKVYDVDFYEGRVFLVLEDVAGQTLDQYVKDQSPDVRWSAQVVAAIARAVHIAHEQGMTHQDLNPRNVLIDREGQPRVIDFGVAWSRPWWVEPDGPSLIGGTPHYLSPEQAWGQSDRIGRATDVFGLGGILFFLLTGKPLYPGDNLMAVLQQARETGFDRKLLDRRSIPPRLRAICLKALAPEPKERFATAADLAHALDRFLASRRWRYAALLASLFLLSFGLAWGIQTFRHRNSAIVAATKQPSLLVRIWRPDTQFQPLLQALPVRAGDELQVHCRVPKGQAVTLYLVNASGKLQTLDHYPTQNEDRDIYYPAAGKTRELKGQPGTEMIFVLGRSDGDRPGPDEVHHVWNVDMANAEWPALKPSMVVRLSKDGVELEEELSRDLGATRDRTDPRERVRQRLEAFRKRLIDRYPYYEGVAFGHE